MKENFGIFLVVFVVNTKRTVTNSGDWQLIKVINYNELLLVLPGHFVVKREQHAIQTFDKTVLL